MSELQKKLIEEFASDSEYAQAYMDSHVNEKLASQIHFTRLDRKLTQQQLAEKAGMAQERVSKIEAGDFSNLNMGTLRKFACALDVTLKVEFQPFGHGIHDVCNLNAKALVVKARPECLLEMMNAVATIASIYGDIFYVGTGVTGVKTLGAPASAAGGSTPEVKTLGAPPIHHGFVA